MAATTALLPGLSQIDAWDTAHLDSAAAFWTSTAQTWEDAFTTVYRQAPFPGGTPWDGEAAEAASQRVGTDRLTVLAAVDALHDAASLARSGASKIQAAKRLAMKAVKDAQAAGFSVGEDLSVTSRINGGPPVFRAARQAQAEAFAANIRSRAAALAAVDEQIASRITSATASLSDIGFDPTPAVPRKPSIQAVDNRILPQEPPPSDPKGPLKPVKTGQDVEDVLDTLKPGRRRGVVTVPTAPEIEELFETLTENATEAPPSDYPGTSRILPDGTRIGLRESSDWGPTIDVRYPDGTKEDVHLPIVNAPPSLWPVIDPAPEAIPPAQVSDPRISALPPVTTTTPLLPPWLQDPSPPGFQIAPGKPMTVPWDWGLPQGAPLPASVPAPVTQPAPPPFTLPSLPQPAPVSPQEAAQAGTAAAAVGGLALLLAMILAPG